MKNLVSLVLMVLAFSFACGPLEDQQARAYARLSAPTSNIPDSLEQHYFIKRYHGYLGNEEAIPMGMLLVNWGDGRLSGNILYENHLGLLTFEGRIHPDGSFELNEQRFNAHNSTYSGRFGGLDSLNGIWWNQDSSNTLPFHFKATPISDDLAEWTGAWHLNDPWDTATLIIGGVSPHEFEFAMNIYINGYRDYFFGTANIIDDTLATVDYLHDDLYTENCRLIFHRRDREVFLDQKSFPFLCGLDHNCWIRGRYEDIYTGRIPKMKENIGTNKIFRDSNMYDKWLAMVSSKNEPRFAYSMERIQYTKGWKEFHGLDGSIWEGRVRGFHREKEAIIAYDKKGNMWSAVTTPPDYELGPMSIYYFTNAPKWRKRLPQFISDWKKEFWNCTVIFASNN
jgi:hypothetical protein